MQPSIRKAHLITDSKLAKVLDLQNGNRGFRDDIGAVNYYSEQEASFFQVNSTKFCRWWSILYDAVFSIA